MHAQVKDELACHGMMRCAQHMYSVHPSPFPMCIEKDANAK